MKKLGPKHWLWIGISILLIAYALYQARFMLLGPRVYIDSPRDNSLLQNQLVTIEGRARNTAWLSLNDRQIFTDEDGYWSEKLIVASGTSIIKVSARDRLGREREKLLHLSLY